jgi:hypothetical protein
MIRERLKLSSAAGYLIRILATVSLLALFPVAPLHVAKAEPAGVTVERYYATWTDEWRTSSTTYVDIQPTAGYYPLKMTFTPAVTGNYMLITSFTISNVATNRQTHVRVLRNGTQLFNQEFTPSYGADYFTSGYTQVSQLQGQTTYTYQMQVMTNHVTGTARIRDATISVIKVENYYCASDDATYNYTAGIYQDGLSLDIPADASGEYLVLAASSVASDSTSKEIYCSLFRGIISQAEIVSTYSRAGEYHGWMAMRIMAFSGTPETIKLRYKVLMPNTCTVNNQKIVAVKLSDLGCDAGFAESELLSVTSSTAYQVKASKSFTLAQPGDYMMISFAMVNGSSTKAGREAYARLNVDNAFYVEKSFKPEAITDYVPLYTFQKYRMTAGSHTVSLEYRSGNTIAITSVRNARVLYIKVNTLQSYQDNGINIRTTFDAGYPTIHLYGYAYQYQWSATPAAPMPYKVAYYDGGAANDGVNGSLVYTHSINSAPNCRIESSLSLFDVPAASYGVWHAVIYRAYSGDAAPAATYSPDDNNSTMEMQFYVNQDALSHDIPPVITAVNLYDGGRLGEAAAMTPQTEHAVKITIFDSYTLSDLSYVRVIMFYDADGLYNAGDIPATGDTQTAAILTCTVGAVPAWTINAGADSTWIINDANCEQPDLSATTGDFWFHFQPGKVATATETAGAARWHIYAEAENSAGPAENYRDNINMNWYGEITVSTPAIDFGIVALGSDFADNPFPDISITYICNGDYRQQIKAGSPWTGDDFSVALDAAGMPGNAEFSLKACNASNLESTVPVSTSFTTFNTGTQTGESGNTESANTIWLKLGVEGIPALTYNGTIYFGIAP